MLLVNAAEGFLVPPRGPLEANAASEEENTFSPPDRVQRDHPQRDAKRSLRPFTRARWTFPRTLTCETMACDSGGEDGRG